MFDDTSWPEPPPRRLKGAAAAFLVATFSICAAAWGTNQPAAPTAVSHSPSNLRQIEIFAGLTTSFYLANAGFHDPHKHHLLATARGAASWTVTWQSDNAATITVRPAQASIISHAVPGFHVNVVSN